MASSPRQADAFIDTIRPYLLGPPESLEGRAGVDMTARKEDDGYAVDMIKTGCPIDPPRGEHHGGFVIRTSDGSDGTWELLSLSVTPECWRDEPMIRRCP